jgi:DNA polymerase-3 subunit chi
MAETQTDTSPDVLFYVLNSTEPSEREAFLSRLLNTIWKQERFCDVRFANLQDAKRYDLTLWNAQPQSFIHHALEKAVVAPIQLYGEQVSQPCKDVLINLHPEFSSQHSLYQRTIEILDQSEYLIQKGRERWKSYKKAGIEPTIHKIGF